MTTASPQIALPVDERLHVVRDLFGLDRDGEAKYDEEPAAHGHARASHAARRIVSTAGVRYSGARMSTARPGVFYGWWVAFGFALMVFLSSAIRFTVGPFLKPMVADLGLDRASISLVLSLSFLLYGAFTPFLGRLADRVGARAVTASGTLVLAGSLAATGLVTRLWHSTLSTASPPPWGSRRRDRPSGQPSSRAGSSAAGPRRCRSSARRRWPG